MIEIKLKINPSAVKETLNRIGIANVTKKTIFPSVYLYETEVDGVKKSFLIHFKEYFQIVRKGAYNNISADDVARLAYIAGLLNTWGMIDCDKRDTIPELKGVRVLSKADSAKWQIKHKIKY